MRRVTAATKSGTTVCRTVPILFSPYACAGVSDKPVPPRKPGVFSVQAEDGVGARVRVEFPLGPDANPSARQAMVRPAKKD